MTTTRMTLRLPVELHSHLVRLAQANDRTLTAEVTRAIRLYVSDQAAAALPHQTSPSPPPDPTPAGSAHVDYSRATHDSTLNSSRDRPVVGHPSRPSHTIPVDQRAQGSLGRVPRP